MNKYLLIYKGSVQPDNGQKHMTEWMAWAQGLGDSLLDPGMPVGLAKTLSADDIQETKSNDPVCGISVIQAADLDSALAMVKPCPHLAIGGTIEVSKAMDMPMA